MAKYYFPFLLLVVFSCAEPIDPDSLIEPEVEVPRTQRIYFPCTKSNGTTDWVYCTPVSLQIGDYEEIESVIMTFDLVSTRGEAEFMAELYDETTRQPITLSQVVASPQTSSMHTYAKTPNLLPYLPKSISRLNIRFRNITNGPSGYINDLSYMTITYK